MSDLRTRIEEAYPDQDSPLLFMDGFDDCIAGVVRRFTSRFVVYDLAKVINKLMAQGMTQEEAIEFWDFNQVGAWVGESTPGFIDAPQEESIGDDQREEGDDDASGQTDGE